MTVTESKPIQILDTAIKPISFLGSAIIFLSIIKSYIFYSTFGIRITNYISFSEAILLFLNEIAVMILYFAILCAVFGLVYLIAQSKNKEINLFDLFLPRANAKILLKLTYLFLYAYPLLYLFYALLMNVHHYGRPIMFVFLLVCVVLMEILIFIFIIRVWKKVSANRVSSGKKAFIYAFTLSIIFFYTWSLERQLFLYHRNKINKEVICYKDGKQIVVTDKNIQFLGATAKYIFCYNILREVAVVIDASKFERIEFGKYHSLPGFSIFDLLYH
jgi:hypothetical protein